MSSTNAHTNYMNGISYFPDDPINQLMMVGCSFFLGEKGYYNPAKNNTKLFYYDNTKLSPYLLFPFHGNKSKQQVFYEATMKALEYNFEEVLKAAYKMRHEFLMRKSPMSVFAIAAAHPSRVEFNKNNPGVFRKYIVDTCILPSDLMSILNAWKNIHGSKSGFPSFLKRAMSSKIQNTSAYQMNKYRRDCIDIIRLSHPKGNGKISELMKDGKLEMSDDSLKWETLRSQGKSWLETLDALNWNMPHMAALRNIRGFSIDVRNEKYITKYCHMLLNGVEKGKQFPFRYYTAYQQIKNHSNKIALSVKNNNKINTYYQKPIRKGDMVIILDTLEKCIQKSISNHPKLKGDVIVLSDNSGSAHGTVTSTYGSNTVAEIGNLSALITALSCTGRGTIGLFGDKLLEYKVDKSKGFLELFDEINEIAGSRGNNVGGGTENGIWLFFKRAMKNPTKYRYDHLFCYSDMQAGHGGLYGNDPDMPNEWLWNGSDNFSQYTKYIHVPKLLENYRVNINPLLSAFMVQTAGYDDSILPQSTYRGAILSGWTGNEVVYANEILTIWDSVAKPPVNDTKPPKNISSKIKNINKKKNNYKKVDKNTKKKDKKNKYQNKDSNLELNDINFPQLS